jgi:repressor LexA
VTTLPLTRRQREILDFYQSYNTEHRISPTLEEVAQHFGVNKVTIFGHVAELQRKGVLSRAGHRVSRGLQVVAQPAPAGSGRASAGEPATVQVLGRIAAGAPIEALEDPQTLELRELLPVDREVYALRVQGESMRDDGIRDGDFVLVESRSAARDGEIVVAILPGEEATLKRLYREKSGFRLEPANSEMKPIRVRQLEVRGVVIGVIRRY